MRPLAFFVFVAFVVLVGCKHKATSVDSIAACQCEKARSLQAKLEATGSEKDEKVLDYMGDILACIEPHTDVLKLLRADQLQTMQQKISAKVEADCGDVMRKVKSEK